MSGGNLIAKFLKVNRENEVQNLHTTGTTYYNRVIPAPFTAATLTGAQMISDLLFDSTTPVAITGASATQVQSALSVTTQLVAGAQWEIHIQNTDVASHTINLGAGFTPSSIVVPAGGYYTYIFENTAVAPNVPAISLLQTLPGGTSFAAGGVTTFNTRSGPVLPASGDYTASQITNVPAGTIASVDVQSAINELDSYTPPVGLKIPSSVTSKEAALDFLARDPYAFSDVAAGVTIGNTWTIQPFTYQAVNSRNPSSFRQSIVVPAGVQLIDPITPQMCDYSVILPTSVITVASNMWVRIIRTQPTSTRFVVAQNMVSWNGIAEAQAISTSGKLLLDQGDTLSIEVMGDGGAGATFENGTINPAIGPQFIIHLL